MANNQLRRLTHQIHMSGASYRTGGVPSSWPDAPGIYAISNKTSGKAYVGSALCLRQRWRTHRILLRRGAHHSIKLQRAWNKYGEAAFSFVVLEPVADESVLITREQAWFDGAYVPEMGYNIAPVAGNCAGMKHSPETRAKMSAAQKGRKLTEDEIKSRRSLRHTEETKARIAAAHRGKVVSPETRAKMSVIAKERVYSDETKRKMSQSKMGHAVSPETRLKMSMAAKAYAVRRKEEAMNGKN